MIACRYARNSFVLARKINTIAMRPTALRFKFIGLLGAILFVTGLHAQSESAPVPHLESPYNTIYVHLYYLQPESYDPGRAAVTFSRDLDSLQRVQAAIKLKQIYDGNGLYVRLNQLPQEANYIDSTTQKPYYTPFPEDLPDVYLEKVGNQWLYSNATVRSIPQLHRQTYPFGTGVLLNLLPRFGQQRFLGLAIWQWLAIGVLFLITWVIHKILTQLFLPLVRRLLRSRWQSEVTDKTRLLKVARSGSFLVIFWMLRLLVPVLQLPISTARLAIIGLNIMLTVMVVLLLIRILRVVIDYALEYANKTEHKMDEQLIPILHKMFIVIFVIGGLIHILRLLDVNVTALIAGISIGGLALALAAQDTVKNLIGSAMIFFDRPFQIGDYVVGSGFDGTIVEVGFRTTRLQTVDTSIVSVPNGTIANMVVKNMGVRVFRLFETDLGVTYDTPPDLIEHFIASLEQMILRHLYTRKEGYYIHLKSLESSSLNIMFRVYMEVPTYADELRVKHELLLGILRLAEVIGVRFAFPSSTLYIEDFPEKENKIPTYDLRGEALKTATDQFLEEFKDQHQQSDESPSA